MFIIRKKKAIRMIARNLLETMEIITKNSQALNKNFKMIKESLEKQEKKIEEITQKLSKLEKK